MTSPWPAGPNTDYARLAELVADTDSLIADSRATVARVEAAIGRPVRLVLVDEPVHLRPHAPGLLPLTDPALGGAA